MSISREMIEQAIYQVAPTYEARKPAEILSGSLETMSSEDAYQVQYGLIKILCAHGQKVIGRKVALTNRATRLQFGVHEPIFGHLMSSGIFLDGNALSIDQFVDPLVEAEVAFLLKHDLRGPGVTPLAVLQATEGVLPAIEVGDIILQGAKPKAIDLIVYNALSAGVVLGPQLTPVQHVNLRYEGVVLELDGELVGSGAGAEVMGGPAHSVAWLANKVAEFDDYLRAGEVIISGSITSYIKVKKGNHIRVTFTRLGSVGVKFT
jgi:2-keto-4-pentenoate hydratase